MKIELVILRFLRAADGVSTPETQLRDDARLATSPPPSTADLNAAFTTLEDKGWAMSVRDPLTGQIRWVISGEGIAQLTLRKL